LLVAEILCVPLLSEVNVVARLCRRADGAQGLAVGRLWQGRRRLQHQHRRHGPAQGQRNEPAHDLLLTDRVREGLFVCFTNQRTGGTDVQKQLGRKEGTRVAAVLAAVPVGTLL
jgi:hypothetical protein